MKIIIIGGSGFIGWKLKRKLELENEVIWTYFKNKSNEKNGIYLDITDRKKVIEKITKINPDIVIHTSAITNMDSCELNEKLAEQVNFLGTQNVVEGCKIIKSKIIFISTSAVFDGSKKQYFENDMTSPVNIYGKTKSKGEKVILNSDLQYLILRIDQPYDWKEKWQHTNSVLRVIDKLSKNEKFHELIDWYNCPTYMPNIVDAVDKLISNNKNGIYHLVGSDFLNRYQLFFQEVL